MYNAQDGDSRLVAYVGNWQTCPTDEQVAAYSHLIIASAISYVQAPNKVICSQECGVDGTVLVCENTNRQDLIDRWQSMGKKVMMHFGGEEMGSSWSGKQNKQLT
eukprot:CCRYP_000773-RA/>CCRYP_000773-RA protein AED:0.54 eAED:0.51 QI:0/0/0/0.5/0/0/2/0/104